MIERHSIDEFWIFLWCWKERLQQKALLPITLFSRRTEQEHVGFFFCCISFTPALVHIYIYVWFFEDSGSYWISELVYQTISRVHWNFTSCVFCLCYLLPNISYKAVIATKGQWDFLSSLSVLPVHCLYVVMLFFCLLNATAPIKQLPNGHE